METKNDIKIPMAFGRRESRGDAENVEISWSELCEKLSTPIRDEQMTMAAYAAASKAEKMEAKNVGFFAGGQFAGGKRKADAITARSLITIDIDEVHDRNLLAGLEFGMMPNWGYEALVYTTRSHSPDAPRIRVVAPLARPVDAEEHDAIVRLLASKICPGLLGVDAASAVMSQIMYLPSANADGEFFAHHVPGEIVEPDAILAGVDLASQEDIPLFEREFQRRVSDGSPAGDPRERSGVAGAFARAYSITSAMRSLIPGVYRPVGGNRFEFQGGEGVAGAIVYEDDLRLYSHHQNSDPCGGVLVGAFDMVRLHRFGDLDEGVPMETGYHALPSVNAMMEFAKADPKVLAEMHDADRPVMADDFTAALDVDADDLAVEAHLAAEQGDAALLDEILSIDDVDAELETGEAVGADDFAIDASAEEGLDLDGALEVAADEAQPEGDWREALNTLMTWGPDARDRPVLKPSSDNIRLILRHDPRVAGVIARDEFSDKIVLRKDLVVPTSGICFRYDKAAPELNETMRNALMGMVQVGVNRGGYDIMPTRDQFNAGVIVAAYQNGFNSLHEALELDEYGQAVVWDGVSRIDDFFVRHIGCEDNAYTRAVSRLTMIGIVARAYEPGCKFDFVPVLEGGEGLRKSDLVDVMALGFYSSLTQGDLKETKKLLEKITGTLVCEFNELAAVLGTDPGQVAALISTAKDQERVAYGKESLTYRRGNIFIGTTNRKRYLEKQDGNRRFWPLEVRKPIDVEAVQREILQCYAEAKVIYEEMRAATKFINSKGDEVDAGHAEAKEVLRYPRHLPLFIHPESEAGKIALALQKSRMIAGGDDSMKGALIGVVSTPVDELQGLDEDDLRVLGEVAVRYVDGQGVVQGEKRYLRSVVAALAHDLAFEGESMKREALDRRNPTAKILGDLPFVDRGGMTMRKRINGYGQQRVFPINVQEMLNMVFRDQGEPLVCENDEHGLFVRPVDPA